MSRLRGFQRALQQGILAEWQRGARNVMAVAPTGAGKTVVMADTVRQINASTLVKAHRHELVTQISMALAVARIPHRIIGPNSIRRDCCSLQIAELGQHWVEANSRTAVAGVDTLVRKDLSNDSWARSVLYWYGDEAHHYQKGNKWGACAAMFPQARGLGVTATPIRADGRGLSRDSDGVFDALVQGPDLRTLIEEGYLTDYRVFAPPSNVVYEDVTIGASGDYSQAKLRAAVHASDKFVGDVVCNYQRIAPGKLGVCFAVDVLSAQEIAGAFKAADVAAEVVSAKTPALRRAQILRDFRARRVTMLVNVDLFGEGFDLPAIEVVIFARKTESYALYAQQFGRALRIMVDPMLSSRWDDYAVAERLQHIAASSKPKAIVIDHVGNVVRHGLPDAPRVWDLSRRERRSSGITDALPLRTCVKPAHIPPEGPCLSVYERYRLRCPDCGWAPIPADRKAPEFVDGDLYELAPETLALLRQRIAAIHGAPPLMGGGFGVQYGAGKHHQDRVVAHYALKEAMDLYGGWRHRLGFAPREIQRQFFHQFGVDVGTAQTLSRAEAEGLCERITAVLAHERIERIPL